MFTPLSSDWGACFVPLPRACMQADVFASHGCLTGHVPKTPLHMQGHLVLARLLPCITIGKGPQMASAGLSDISRGSLRASAGVAAQSLAGVAARQWEVPAADLPLLWS